MSVTLAMGALAMAKSPLALKVGSTVALGVIAKAWTMVKQGQKISSLSDVTKPVRVEPLAIIEDSLADQEFMEDILKSSLSMFIGYWMQAVTLTGVSIGGIEPRKVLSSLNPDRGKASDLMWSMESYQDGLPGLEAFQTAAPPNLLVSVEAANPNAEVAKLKNENDKLRKDNERIKDKGSAVQVTGADKFYEIPNLVVGKMVDVELRDKENSAKFPVLFRLIPSRVPTPVLSHIFTATAKNSSFKERYHLWRAGQLRFVKDLILATDIVDEHRKALINDTTNVYATMTDRRRNNSMIGAHSNTPSMADASNIAVISKATARDMAREVGGRIEDVRTRKKLFDATYLILLVVVDEQWERVSIYHRGIDQPTEARFQDLKTSEKGKGPDIAEILKAYSVGATASI